MNLNKNSITTPTDDNFLLLTKSYSVKPFGGRDLLCKLNNNALSLILRERLLTINIANHRRRSLRSKLFSLIGFIDGIDHHVIKSTLDFIGNNSIKRVFVDGSSFGCLVSFIKKRFPQVEVITFFHNVEARFFWGSFRAEKTLHSVAVLIAIYFAERNAVRFSDKRICLSERDSIILKKIYGKGGTHILPLALEDQKIACSSELISLNSDPFALFVGGDFYANREGIKWFVKHVVPSIGIRICIVGKGMEALRSQLQIPNRVDVLGLVDNLADWYRRARFVIAPIFDGSGMKTKVAEALMHGKKVIGTAEAFSGYDDNVKAACWCCNNSSEFVEAIYNAVETIEFEYDPAMRDLFEKHYSFSAATERFNILLNSGD